MPPDPPAASGAPRSHRPSDVLWHAGAPDSDDPLPLEGDHEAEVAVVGGGITGLSTALHLAEAGTRVALLEGHCIAWGASGRNAGVIAPNFAGVDPDTVVARLGTEQGEQLNRMVGESGDLVFDLIRKHGIDCDAEQTGFVQPAHALSAVPAVRRRFEQWNARGRQVQFLEREAIAGLTGVACFAAGWIDASGGHVQPVKYTVGLAAAAQRAGAAVFSRTPVERLAQDRGGWRLHTPAGSLRARAVVLATNAYAGRLWPRLARTIIPLVIHQAATEPVDAETARRVLPGRQAVTDTRGHPFSFRYDRDNRLISGAVAAWPWHARRRMRRYMARRLERLLDLPSEPRVEFIWSGTAALTTDFLPRIFRAAPGVYAGFGCNGRGVAFSTALGRVLAEVATGAEERSPLTPQALAPLTAHWLVKRAPMIAVPWRRLRDRLAEGGPGI